MKSRLKDPRASLQRDIKKAKHRKQKSGTFSPNVKRSGGVGAGGADYDFMQLSKCPEPGELIEDEERKYLVNSSSPRKRKRGMSETEHMLLLGDDSPLGGAEMPSLKYQPSQ